MNLDGEDEDNCKENSVVFISHRENERKFSTNSEEPYQDARMSSETESGHTIKPDFISVSSSKQHLGRESVVGEEVEVHLLQLGEKMDCLNSLCQHIEEKLNEIGLSSIRMIETQETTSEKLP